MLWDTIETLRHTNQRSLAVIPPRPSYFLLPGEKPEPKSVSAPCPRRLIHVLKRWGIESQEWELMPDLVFDTHEAAAEYARRVLPYIETMVAPMTLAAYVNAQVELTEL